MNFSTMVSMTAGVSDPKVTMASRRLRNSGLNTRSSAALARDAAVLRRASSSGPAAWPKPIDAADSSREPALEVMISTTCRKSALRPLLSVSVAWSITCSRMLNTSWCAFSISSRRTTL